MMIAIYSFNLWSVINNVNMLRPLACLILNRHLRTSFYFELTMPAAAGIIFSLQFRLNSNFVAYIFIASGSGLLS